MTILSTARHLSQRISPITSPGKFGRIFLLDTPSNRTVGVFVPNLFISTKFKSSNKEVHSQLVWQSRQIRELKYNNFGHKRDPTDKFSIVWHIILGFGIFGIFFWDTPWMLIKAVWSKINPKVEAASILENGEESAEEKNPAVQPRAKVGFRERKIIEYENRIRHYSTPDKVFRYFATLQVVHPNGETEIFMTPDDFLRSITPGIRQPDGLGLDHYKRVDSRETSNLLVEDLKLSEDSIFLKLGSSGLISFSDYIFLLTVLSTSKRHFEIAFRMFDINGDGSVDADEFDQVTQFLCHNTSHGTRHRDVSGNVAKSVNSALSAYFFGAERDQKLTIEKFLEFHEKLQTEILTLEFERRNLRDDKTLSETDFAELLLAYAGFSYQRNMKILKRVRKQFKDNNRGITLADYLGFFRFLSTIGDVDTALTFYHLAGASIDSTIFKHVAFSVANVDLDDHIVEVIFTIFDENQDGQLSNREFVAVLKERAMRGLEKPKDTGFIKFLESAINCVSITSPKNL